VRAARGARGAAAPPARTAGARAVARRARDRRGDAARVAAARAARRVRPAAAGAARVAAPPLRAALRADESLRRNFVSRSVVTKSDADVTARDGFVYAAYRPEREASARAALAPLGATPEVLARTPVLVLVRVPAAPALQ